MAKFSKYFGEYFSFTRKERTGIIIVIIMILGFSLLPLFFPFFIKHKPVDHTAFQREISQLKIKEPDSSGRFNKAYTDENNYPQYSQQQEKSYYNRQSKAELFYFDPNTLSAGEWKKLGVRERTITTIQNYISKGGRFYKPGDIGKIWGLHEDEINRLMPYVRIENKQGDNTVRTEFNKTNEKPRYSPAVVDINTADTSAFIALPGIGSKLAGRIITFREKLGGFYKIEQVAETYGLTDSTFQNIRNKLVLNDPSVKKININTATAEEMRSHPYIRFNIANAVVQYRNQHGNFTSIDGLRNIMIITGEVYAKMEPYITIHQ
jgi:competence protein ComEA